MDRGTSTCLRKRSITAWSESGLHCEYIFKCFLTVGRNKWRIYIHELFDFGLCCMESFSSLASIRKLLKFVAALSKYMYMISFMILFTQAVFPCYHEIKNNFCKMRYGYKQICNAFWGGWKNIAIKISNMIVDFYQECIQNV